MKKFSIGFMVALTLVGVFVLGFGYKTAPEPNNYYEVYLNDESLGTIRSEKELEDYIDENGAYYKNKFDVDKVYSPKGLQVRKLTTYSGNVSSVSEIYKKISKEEPLTIKGYEFIIKKQTDEKNAEAEDTVTTQSIYVLDKSVFKDAVTTLIKTFVGADAYQAYIDDNQVKIETTGENIEDVYVSEDITVRETNIPVNETIYTDATELANYLLYGKDQTATEYTVQAGDTIENVAFNNKISPEELLLSNTALTSTTNLLYPGQKLKIVETNPQISVVEESYVVEDIESQYTTEERYDDNTVIGQDKVIQEGENGLERVSQKVRKVNGIINYVDPQGKTVLKEPVSRIIVKGNKYIPDVGSTTSWGWPTDSGWTLSSGYVWRTNPVTGKRELHGGLDISGTGYGSKIYATNNGRVKEASYHYSYGNHVIIDHNNGYLTLYAHMSRINVKVGQVVARGDVIGYVGMTGTATGPHVHYEIWKGCDYCRINPMSMY
ncbi:peptidase M23B [Firmicutes bacterium CAG:822]|nr:peptidase M23B [Firmicutes bacterium CAG:822]